MNELINFVCDHYFLSGIILLILIVIIKEINNVFFKYKQRTFAAFISKFCSLYNEITVNIKTKLFAPLHGIQSNDLELKQQGKIRILEVGCGSGANLQFLPKGSRLVMLDLNAAFEPLLRENLGAHPELQLERFVLGRMEDMHDVPDASVDAVVCTLVLCSVAQEARALSEVLRVLVPGGTFFFLEHVGAKHGALLKIAQWILTTSGFWPYFFCGCDLTKDIGKMVKQAGFSSVKVEPIEVYSDQHIVFKFIKTQIVGVAIK